MKLVIEVNDTPLGATSGKLIRIYREDFGITTEVARVALAKHQYWSTEPDGPIAVNGVRAHVTLDCREGAP